MPPISMVLFALIVTVVAHFAISRSDQPTDEEIDRPTVTVEAGEPDVPRRCTPGRGRSRTGRAAA